MRQYALELYQLARLYRRSIAHPLGDTAPTSNLLGIELSPADVRSVLLFAEYLRYRRSFHATSH
jgi:hypothetical protein